MITILYLFVPFFKVVAFVDNIRISDPTFTILVLHVHGWNLVLQKHE